MGWLVTPRWSQRETHAVKSREGVSTWQLDAMDMKRCAFTGGSRA